MLRHSREGGREAKLLSTEVSGSVQRLLVGRPSAMCCTSTTGGLVVSAAPLSRRRRDVGEIAEHGVFKFSAAPARGEPRRKRTDADELVKLMTTDELSVQYGACLWGGKVQVLSGH